MRHSRQFKDHRLYPVWSQIPVTYYQEGVENNFLQNLWHKSKINLAKRILSKTKFINCLDVGCASGYMISEISKALPKADYVGVDIYNKAKKNTFDLILFYETIEHVEDPKVCLQEIKRVSKKGGTLIVTMDSGNLLFRLIWLIWENSKGKIWKGAHLHPFHHQELEKIIKNAGFNIKKKIFSFFDMEVTFELTKK